MYNCIITGKQSKHGDKLNRLVVATRSKKYSNYDPESEETWESFGSEIVKEIGVSEEGLTLWNSWSEEDRSYFLKTL